MTPAMRQFNSLVALFDNGTQYRFDRCDVPAILSYIRANWGEQSAWARNFERQARAVGYVVGAPLKSMETQAK